MKKIIFMLIAISCTLISYADVPLFSFAFDYKAMTDKTIDFSSDSKFVAFGTNDGKIKVMNLITGAEEMSYQAHPEMAISVKFHPDGNLLVSGGKDGSVKLYDIVEKKEVLTFQAHEKAIICIRFSPDGTKIFTGSRDNTVRIFDMVTGKELLKIADIKGNVRAIEFNPDGKSIIISTAAIFKSIKIYSLADGHEIKTLEMANTERIDVAPNGNFIAAATLDKSVFIWNIQTGNQAFTLSGHKKYIRDVAFSSGGKMLASCSEDNMVILWDIEKGVAIHTFSGHSDNVTSISYSNDGTMLATASWDGTLKIWDLRPYNVEMVKEAPVVSVGVVLETKVEDVLKSAFNNLTFETGSATIAASSFPSLDELANTMIAKKEYMLMIEGHTDNVGSDATNLTLSKNRAQAVKKYLVSKGVEESKLISNGYGSKRPIADNKTEAGKKQNRRVEMKIVGV